MCEVRGRSASEPYSGSKDGGKRIENHAVDRLERGPTVAGLQRFGDDSGTVQIRPFDTSSKPAARTMRGGLHVPNDSAAPPTPRTPSQPDFGEDAVAPDSGAEPSPASIWCEVVPDFDLERSRPRLRARHEARCRPASHVQIFRSSGLPFVRSWQSPVGGAGRAGVSHRRSADPRRPEVDASRERRIEHPTTGPPDDRTNGAFETTNDRARQVSRSTAAKDAAEPAPQRDALAPVPGGEKVVATGLRRGRRSTRIWSGAVPAFLPSGFTGARLSQYVARAEHPFGPSASHGFGSHPSFLPGSFRLRPWHTSCITGPRPSYTVETSAVAVGSTGAVLDTRRSEDS